MRVGWRFRNEFDLCIFVNKRSALMSPKTGPTPPRDVARAILCSDNPWGNDNPEELCYGYPKWA